MQKIPCEIKGLPNEDPRTEPWTPGEYILGVDNVEKTDESVTEYGGQRLWKGDRPPRGFAAKKLPPEVQRLLEVPHMPGQPLKESYARLKAINPRRFEEKEMDDIFHDLPEGWRRMRRHAVWAESFGLHTLNSAAEWAGMELELTPSLSLTTRSDTLSIAVGLREPDHDSDLLQLKQETGSEYDFLELLYAKDQEGKVIQIRAYPSPGIRTSGITQYDFMPPRGTETITPFATFRIRGAWQGDPIDWDPTVANESMEWFTNMKPELRKSLCESTSALTGKSRVEVESIKHPKSRKETPILWPEASYEGNAAGARSWDAFHQ